MVGSLPSAIFKSTKNATIAVPSLSKLSPSIRIVSFFEAPISFINATTAMGSVAEMIEPNRRH